MGTKYSSLDELRRKKELLKKEVSEIEDLITFDNTKESLSAFTNGFTDKYLKRKLDLTAKKACQLIPVKLLKNFRTALKNLCLTVTQFMVLPKAIPE